MHHLLPTTTYHLPSTIYHLPPTTYYLLYTPYHPPLAPPPPPPPWADRRLCMQQYAEADPSQTDRIVDAMYRFVGLAHTMLGNNYTGLLPHGDDAFDTNGFGPGRSHELHIPLQWLYEKHPRPGADGSSQQTLWETMERMIAGGVLWGGDWRAFWTEEAFPVVYYGDDSTPFDMSWVFLHGVNMAEGACADP